MTNQPQTPHRESQTSHPSHPSNPSNRKRTWWVTLILLTATLAVGAATQSRSTLMGVGGGKTVHGNSNSNHAVTLTGNVDRTAVMVGGDGLVRVELVMQARNAPDATLVRQPTDLVVVLDRSGSMQGQKIADAHAAVRQLISQLSPEDRFALVAFSSSTHLAIPLSHATPTAAADWQRTVGSIGAGGGTYMAPGLGLAFDTIEASRGAGRTPRVILISDGRAAEPDSVLLEQAVRAARGEFALSAVGVGTDFNENLMASLSDAGTGNYYYLADSRNLAEVFMNEFETARETVASGLTVKIRPAPGVSVLDASGYPLEQANGAVSFRPGSLFANQQRHVWVTFRVPTGTEAQTALGSVDLAYTDGGEAVTIALDELPQIACVAEERDFFANLDVDRWAKSVVVEEYNDLAQKVAGYVQAGRKDEARAEVERFQERNRSLNRVAASPAVAAQLAASEDLEESIEGAFVGADAAKKQNLLGKALHADAYSKRREGSRK